MNPLTTLPTLPTLTGPFGGSLGPLALLLIGAFTLWSLVRQRGPGSAAHLFRCRNLAALAGLLPCLIMTSLALPAVGLLPPLASGLGGAMAFLAYAAMDPSRQGFWHHRRLRPLGVVAIFLAAAALSLVLPAAELLPAVFAAAIFHRHQRRGTALIAQSFDDIEALRLKVLSLDVERHLHAAGIPAAKLPDDRSQKAG